MNYDVIIVGAGASGLMAAIAAARQGSSVLVIEHKDKAGKKILATGNGKCNFTNMIQKPECYRSDDSAFAMKVLSCFDVSQTLQFFEELGIYPKNRDGYLYPNSEQASSVVQVLLMECGRLKVTIRYNERVREFRKPDFTVVTEYLPVEADRKRADKNKSAKNKSDNNSSIKNKSDRNTMALMKPNSDRLNSGRLNIAGTASDSRNSDHSKKLITNQKALSYQENSNNHNTEHQYHGSKLILAAGGCASPSLGSDGCGYELAGHFGHTIIKPLPALVQLKSSAKYLKTVSGVRTAARVTVFSGQKPVAEETGEILFTDYGISGIPVLQISRFAAKALDHGENVHLQLDFMPEVASGQLSEMLLQRISQNPAKNMEEMMVGLLNHKLSYILLKEAGLDVYNNAQQISNQELNRLVKNIKQFDLPVTDTNSFENAQVCAGGVSTKELDDRTMESRLRKNLFLTGELLDVDGTCGGYNLQWAWSSGYLAGTAAGKK